MRRLRFDDLTTKAMQASGGAPGEAPLHSCRRLVVGGGVLLLVLWMIVFLAFREWRTRYRERARFGAVEVAPAVDRFAEIGPPGIDPIAWREAVRDTRDMIRAVTGSNLLDLGQMKALRDELNAAASRSRAHPEAAAAELAGIWDAMADRAEFLLNPAPSGRRPPHPRPTILPPRPPPSSEQPRPGRYPQASIRRGGLGTDAGMAASGVSSLAVLPRGAFSSPTDLALLIEPQNGLDELLSDNEEPMTAGSLTWSHSGGDAAHVRTASGVPG
ncbi:hypothetical protein OJF2_75970 [Aquisphaera giovannonii]|uniref:Uncharacterized protein n=1 Tax=Aquisphaera giovannonii TaxID=406548 RepID=A0A5B9WG38_9BACT|nr:hypothetical protein [Aquisphaera giovannonii]QEH38985.1 hypothetical protein OJF2_75970 [Aquisphaera giovannonii]